jgi:hypothetical protein
METISLNGQGSQQLFCKRELEEVFHGHLVKLATKLCDGRIWIFE